MTLKITVVEGPNAGQTYEFGDDVDLVEVGRDPEACKVVFPPNYTQVGRRHVAIRRTGGRYKLETNLQNPVQIDGREPFDEEPLGTSQEIRLGRGGPRLRVETVFLNALPATDPGARSRRLAPSAVVAGQRRATRWVSGVVALVILAVAGTFGYFYWQEQQAAERERVAQAQAAEQQRQAAERERQAEERQRAAEQQLQALVGEVGAVKEAANRAPVPVPADTQTITPETIARVSRSVYLVMVQDANGRVTPAATAWVVRDGILATNAHVAAIGDELKPGETMIVRSTVAPYTTVKIDRAVKHPDYDRFQAAWERAVPIRVGADSSTELVEAAGVGYDVGLLYAAPGSQLAPPLPLATPDELHHLQAGQSIAFTGFPMEQITGGGVNPAAPVPTVQVGAITSVSDYFLLPSTDDERFLISHSLGSAGGASGSPIINAKGEVVALLNAGNIIIQADGSRAPSAAGINYGQRADLVTEMLDNQADALRPARDAFWTESFGRFDDPFTAIPPALMRDFSNQLSQGAIEPTQVAHYDGTMSSQLDGGTYVQEFKGVIAKPGVYLAIAMSKSREDIDLTLAQNGNILVYDNEPNWWPFVKWANQDGKPIDAVITAEQSKTPPDYDLTIWYIPTGRVSDTAPPGQQAPGTGTQ